MQRPNAPISDRELKRLIQALREDVAAPQDFRQRVLRRLQAEGLVAAAPAPARRWTAWSSPARWGLALGAAAALALVLTRPAPPVGAPKAPVNGSPVVAAAPAPRAAAPAALAKREAAAKPAAQPAIAIAVAPAPAASMAVLEQEGLGQAAELGLGQAPQAPPSNALSVASAPGGVNAAEAKPTVIVIEPSPTPLVKGLGGDSEVRNNVVRASRGEAALILFKVQQPGQVRVDIFDRLGRPVAVLKDASYAPGLYSLRWGGEADEGGSAASGIYLLRIQAPGYEARHKLVLVK